MSDVGARAGDANTAARTGKMAMPSREVAYDSLTKVNARERQVWWNSPMRSVVGFDAELCLVVLAVDGIVDGAKLIAVLKQMDDRPPPFDPVGVVWDFRDADLAALDLDGMRSAWTARSSRTRPTVRRIALVATGEAEKLLLRLWADGVHPRDNRERRVFDDLEAACTWAAGAQGDDTPTTC